MSSLKKLKVELPYDPAILSKGNKNSMSNSYLYSHVHSSIISNSQDMETPKCPSTDNWIEMMLSVYTQQNIIQPLKRRKSCYLQQCGRTLKADAK